MTLFKEIENFFEPSPLSFMRVVPFNKIIFDQRCEFLCKYGCKNYRRKYCCPPDSLKLAQQIKKRKFRWALLAATSFPLPEKISVFKKRNLNRQKELEIQRISTSLDSLFKKNGIEHIVLSGGACKKCKICSKQENLACKKPDEKLTSMEAVGIDCQRTLTSAGFDFEMPAINSINRCTTILFDDENDLSSINWKNKESYQFLKKIKKEEIQLACKKLLEENSKMFNSIELISIKDINRRSNICDDPCAHYSSNFSCPPYSNKINLQLWDNCILWSWRKNTSKKNSYNQALRKVHTTIFSLGLYFAFSVRDCFCDECSSCEYALNDSPICNYRKIMAPSMQSQDIDPLQFGEDKFGLEFI